MDSTVVTYAVLALSLFISAIKLGDWIVRADPRAIINAGRWSLVALVLLALGSLLWLVATGRWTLAMMMAAFTLPVVVQAAPRWRVLFAPLNVGFRCAPDFAPYSPTKRPGPPDTELLQQSVATLRAYVNQPRQPISATQNGADIPNALAHSSAPAARMSTEEALQVLGLMPNAQEITDAHLRLEQRLNPELGGSHYLNKKIDEARDVLLGERSEST